MVEERKIMGKPDKTGAKKGQLRRLEIPILRVICMYLTIKSIITQKRKKTYKKYDNKTKIYKKLIFPNADQNLFSFLFLYTFIIMSVYFIFPFYFLYALLFSQKKNYKTTSRV